MNSDSRFASCSFCVFGKEKKSPQPSVNQKQTKCLEVLNMIFSQSATVHPRAQNREEKKRQGNESGIVSVVALAMFVHTFGGGAFVKFKYKQYFFSFSLKCISKPIFLYMKLNVCGFS